MFFPSEWSNLAVGTLSEIQKDAHYLWLTADVLARKLNMWAHSSCINIADETDNKEFISHTACQSYLSDIWHGDINGIPMLLLVRTK